MQFGHDGWQNSWSDGLLDGILDLVSLWNMYSDSVVVIHSKMHFHPYIESTFAQGYEISSYMCYFNALWIERL